MEELTKEMGFKSSADLRDALESSRKRVREIYEKIVSCDS